MGRRQASLGTPVPRTLTKTTSFKKKGNGKKGNFKKKNKPVAAQGKKPKSRPKPETECFYCKGTGH